LRRSIGIKYAALDPILEELDRDGRIRRTEEGMDEKGLSRQIITLI
jgi:DNA-binding HxlR family transcriptional regulator